MRYVLTIILLTGIALAIPVTAFCQPDTLFTHTYERTWALPLLGFAQTNDGYVIGCAGFEVEEHGTDFELIKLDSEYEIEWRQYDHSGRNEIPTYDECNAVRLVPDRGYVLAGQTSGAGMIIRTDADGEEIWRQNIEGTVDIHSIEEHDNENLPKRPFTWFDSFSARTSNL